MITESVCLLLSRMCCGANSKRSKWLDFRMPPLFPKIQFILMQYVDRQSLGKH